MKKRADLHFSFLILFLLSFSALFIAEGPLGVKFKKIDFSSLIPSDVLFDDCWYGIYFQDNFIGYSHFQIKVQNPQEQGGYLLKSSSAVKLPVFGVLKPLSLESQIYLQDNLDLKTARFELIFQEYFLKGILKRNKGDIYSLSLESPGKAVEKTVRLTDEVIVSWLSPFSLSYFPLKKSLSVLLYDPFFDRRLNISFNYKGKTSLKLDAKDVQAHLVLFNLEGLEGEMFLNEKGRVLKKNFLGFSLIKEDIQSVLAKNKNFLGADLGSSFSVQPDPAIDKKILDYFMFGIKGKQQ